MPVIDVRRLLKERGDKFKFELLAGKIGLGRKITVSDLNRPGLALAGFFDHFPYERVQIIGINEYLYLKQLDHSVQVQVLTKLFSHKSSVCCVLTRCFTPTDAMLKVFTDLGVPLLRTGFRFSSFMSELVYYLDSNLAPSVKIHGVLTNVYGLGVLIIGRSAIGKSECALELVKRGHKLVADDVVDIIKRFGRNLVGRSLDISKHLLEVRGIGIIDIKDLFGMGSILDESCIELVIKFEEWNSIRNYERLRINEHYIEFLSLKIPEITIPVAPGRNLAVIVETASLNQRFKSKGQSSIKDFNYKLQKNMNKSRL
jgi:HPr kinase/phosphorylase